MNPYYPVMVDLRGRRCLVIGGGEVAEEKVEGLLASGALVRLITSQPGAPLRARIGRGEIEHLDREVRPGDLEGAFLVFSERLGEEVHGMLRDEAERRQVFLNVQDETPYCSFIAPSVVRKGDLVVALSTGGRAPVLAVRLRQWLESELGEHHARFLEVAGHVREPLLRRHPDFRVRRMRWYRLIDSEVFDLLRDGRDREALDLFVRYLGLRPEDLVDLPPWRDVPIERYRLPELTEVAS